MAGVSPEPMQLEGRKEQQKFVRIPVESVQSCVDQLGVKTTEDVPGGLVEDVSFRLRQITDTAAQFMHHAKRRRLTVDDVDKAMKFYGLETLYGYHCPSSEQYEQEDVLLDDVALAPPAVQDESVLLSNRTPSMTTSWLMVEGVELGDKEVSKGVVQISPGITESQQAFLSTILEAVTGEDEDHRRIVLAMVQNNLSVASVLPALVQYLQQTLMKWEQFTPVQLDRVLKLFLSLFKNSGLFLDPYCSALFPSLKEIILSPSYLSSSSQSPGMDASSLLDHWDTRKMAAASLAQLLSRCSSMLSAYLQELSCDFQTVLAPPHSSSLPMLYGVILTLVFHGPATLVEVFCPHMQLLVRHLTSLSEAGTPEVKRDVNMVMEAILLTAELLLTSDTSASLPILKPLSMERTSSTRSVTTGRGLISPGSDVMDHSSRLASSSAPGTAGSLFGSPSLSLHPGSVLESDLQDSNGGKQTKSKDSSVSLYSFFAELFGEGLSIRLMAHNRYKAQGQPKPIPEESKTSGRSVSFQQRDEMVVKAVDRFLEREGFKCTRVQLPCRTPPVRSSSSRHRSVHGGRAPWTFPLPQTILPVSENPLERERCHRMDVQGAGQSVIKGPRVKEKGNRKKFHLMDVGGAWL